MLAHHYLLVPTATMLQDHIPTTILMRHPALLPHIHPLLTHHPCPALVMDGGPSATAYMVWRNPSVAPPPPNKEKSICCIEL